jgi:hypothetical protein
MCTRLGRWTTKVGYLFFVWSDIHCCNCCWWEVLLLNCVLWIAQKTERPGGSGNEGFVTGSKLSLTIWCGWGDTWHELCISESNAFYRPVQHVPRKRACSLHWVIAFRLERRRMNEKKKRNWEHCQCARLRLFFGTKGCTGRSAALRIHRSSRCWNIGTCEQVV